MSWTLEDIKQRAKLLQSKHNSSISLPAESAPEGLSQPPVSSSAAIPLKRKREDPGAGASSTATRQTRHSSASDDAVATPVIAGASPVNSDGSSPQVAPVSAPLSASTLAVAPEPYDPVKEASIPDNLLFGTFGLFKDAAKDIHSMKVKNVVALLVRLGVFPSADRVPSRATAPELRQLALSATGKADSYSFDESTELVSLPGLVIERPHFARPTAE
jgi:hypothetical protein